MKRFTKKAILVLLAMAFAGSVFSAEKRYVFILGGFPKTDPGWGSSWVDYRVDDLNRVLYIWPDGTTLAGVPAVGTGAMGQAAYTAFTVGNKGWWGCGYYVGPANGNATASMDMTDITSTWKLHFAVRTDCASSITVTVYGSTVDPSDPFITTMTSGAVVLNTTLLPLTKRDKIQWTSFDIPVSQFQSNVAVGTTPNNLVFKGPVKAQNYITFAGGNDTGSFVAWDNVYYTNGITAVDQVKADNLEIHKLGNIIRVFDNAEKVEIFNVNGTRVISTMDNDIDISALAAGIYVVKAGNRVNKFNK